MRTHLQRDLDRLRKEIRLLGALVNEATDRSIQAISAPGAANLEEIEAAEDRINDFEIEVEDECLEPLATRVDFPAMGEIARRMAHLSVESLINEEIEIARQVLEMDEEVDEMHASHYGILEDAMRSDPEVISTAVCYLGISMNLERIGDLSSNIAEETLFLEEGEIQRHMN